jgi:predicted secreted protein
MGWATGIMVYFLCWWTVLFAVLPFGVQPDAEGSQCAGGWRGAPSQPGILRKALWTTVVATLVWFGIYALVNSDWLSFRHGWLAMQPR